MARSKAYPVITLPEAVAAAERIIDQLGKGAHDRDSLGRALGYSSGGGLPARKVAALVQFGLFDQNNAEYSPTSLLDSIMHPVSEEELRQSKVTAFQSPNLYAELVNKYRPQGRVPSALANILVRDHGITSKVAKDAAEGFVVSGQYAGELDGQGCFGKGRDTAPVADDRQATPPVDVAVPAVGRTEDAASGASAATRVSPPVGGPGRRQFPITLSEGTGLLDLPRDLSKEDLEKLRRVVAAVIGLIEVDST